MTEKKPSLLYVNKITLMGDPIPRYQGKWPATVAFINRPDVIVGGICTAFFMAASTFSPFFAQTPFIAGGAIAVAQMVFSVAERASERKSLLSSMFIMMGSEESLKQKCINKKPEKDLSCFSPLWAISAIRAKDVHKRQLVSMALNYGVSSCLIGASAYKYDPLVFLIPALICVPTFFRAAQGICRWNKVLKGEWVIEDKPKRQKRLVYSESETKLKLTPSLSAN